MNRTTHNLSRQAGVVDRFTLRRNSGREVDWNLVSDRRRPDTAVIKLNGAVTAADVSMTVDALPVAVPAGTLLNFGEASETVRVTTAAAKGATTLAIDPAPTGIEDNDEATIKGSLEKSIKPLTVMAELASGKIIPRGDVTGAETANCIIETAAAESDVSCTGYGTLTGGALYENLMPDAVAGDVSSTYKTELKNNNCTFTFEDYGDNTTL